MPTSFVTVSGVAATRRSPGPLSFGTASTMKRDAFLRDERDYRNVTLAEAPSYGRPALLYNMASSGAQAYLSLAKEFVVHGEKSPR